MSGVDNIAPPSLETICPKSTDNLRQRLSQIPAEAQKIFTHMCHLALLLLLGNQEAIFVPVAERNNHRGRHILFVASPLGFFFNVPTWCIRRELLHPSLLNTRGRDSDLMQVCFAALFLLFLHFLA